MILPIPESSTFFFVSCNCVICDSDMCHTSVMHDITSYPSSMSKVKMKTKVK